MLSSHEDNKGIPLVHAPSSASSASADTGYRLLELPPELLALLESDNPPPLRLEPAPAAGLLRAPDADGRTWSLRQKNTSNALILLRAEGGLVLESVATLHETVELVPEAARAEAPVVPAKGKWHEKFGRTR